METKLKLPEPTLESGSVTFEQYWAFTPEKLELFSGYLVAPKNSPEERRRLLALLLVNVGLVEVVKLAPAARWREALDSVYG